MTYDILASYYDALVKDDEATRDWADWIGQRGSTLLDCAAGSGEITCRLADMYDHVDAIDLSEQMIRQAGAKDDRIGWMVRDMTDLEGLGTYDVITCLCDSINYLDREQLLTFLDQVKKHLTPAGWFLFDMHSQDRIGEFADGYVEAGEFEDGTQVQWTIESEGETLYQDFAFYLPDGRTVQEHHRQYIHDPAFVQAELEKRFVIERITTDFDLDGLQPGEKYFYICRKKEKDQ